jgi:hypothetical protein
LAPPVQQGSRLNAKATQNFFFPGLDARCGRPVQYLDAISHTKEQASCRIVIQIAVLGFHAPGFPIPGVFRNAQGHQWVSLSSKYDAEKYRWTRQIAQCKLPSWMAFMNLYEVLTWVNCFFRVIRVFLCLCAEAASHL